MMFEEQQAKQKEVWKINDAWAQDLEGENCPFYMNEPFVIKDDRGFEAIPYWQEKYKIVFCNLATYAEHMTDENHTLTWDIFQQWMDNPKGPTIHKTALFCYYLRKVLAGESIPTEEQLTDAYHREYERIKESMQHICYMNLYKFVGDKSWRKEADLAWEFYDKTKSGKDMPQNRQSQRELIEALQPHIFIITGITPREAGYELLNRIYKNDEHYKGSELCLNDAEGNFQKLEGISYSPLFVAMKHPCSPQFNHTYIVKMLEEIQVKTNA